MKSSNLSHFLLNDAGCFSFSSVGRGFSLTFRVNGSRHFDGLYIDFRVLASVDF
jgi:hypothetical protein